MSYTDAVRKYTKSGREILIRSAHVSDARSIIEIKAQVIDEKIYMLRERDEASFTEESETADINSHLECEGCAYIVAVHEGKIAGFIELMNGKLRRTRHAGMLSIFIAKEYRGDGIGSMLMEELVRWAEKDQLIEKLTLAVFSVNERAIALYKKFGFETEGVCSRDMKLGDGTYIDSILMYRFVK